MINWRKSSHSGSATTQSDCVEIAQLPGAIAIRDSKAASNGHLTLSPADFGELVSRLKRDGLAA